MYQKEMHMFFPLVLSAQVYPACRVCAVSMILETMRSMSGHFEPSILCILNQNLVQLSESSGVVFPR